jgi:hypothetical protein
MSDGAVSTAAAHNSTERTTEEKVADAIRAAPAFISDSATVVDRDLRTVLRQGTSEWTCVPSSPGVPWPNPMCADPTTMQWFKEIGQGKVPTIDRVGISYMLMGETGADFDHPELESPPEDGDWYRVGPHVMFVFPQSAGDITRGIGHDTSSGAPYVRPFDGAQPLLVVPIALPNEEIRTTPPS